MKRLHYLDSLRGIAAMMVVIYHFIGWHWADELPTKIALVFINGGDAVSFFFVLSGFVLSYKYFHSDREIHIPTYTFKRVLRLYPAFLLIVLINFLSWNSATFDLSHLADIFFQNKKELLEELLMLRVKHKFYLPGWTLGVEMAISLLMPFMIVIAKKDIKLLYYLMPISVFVGGYYISSFLLHFLIGMALSYHYKQIEQYDLKTHKLYAYRWLLLPIFIFLFSARHLDKIVYFGDFYHFFMYYLAVDFFHLSAISSIVVIFLAINNKATQRFLEKKPLLFIGKISYSIYLTHWLIVVRIMKDWSYWSFISTNENVVYYTMLFVTIVATIICSIILYYAVEKPFINLAYKWTSSWAKNKKA